MTFFSQGRPTAKTWTYLLWVYWLALFAGTHIPKDVHVLDTGIVDKFVHCLAFAVLALLVATSWELSVGHLWPRHLLAVFVLLAVYGAVDEITQLPIRRDGNVRDWLADLAGAAIGLLVFRYFFRAWLLAGKPDSPS